MTGKERLEEEKQYIQNCERVTVAELSRNWGITQETARRDLDKLEADGFIIRVHGGAVWNKQQGQDNIRFYERQTHNTDAKRRIAVKASELIRSSGTVMADSSTTVVEAMKLQMDEESLIVVTNSIDLCMELTDAKMHIISTGGNFNKHSMSFQGAITKKTLMQYNVRLAVISCKGLDASKGVLDSYESEAEIKKLMIMQSEKTALLVDHNKFDRKAFLKVADLSEIDYIVTDEKPSDEWISLCEEKGIQLIY
jgi:DeoR/GlpR family transcriptional regulator of sugar metabolism